jgi:hypothetical protein
VLDGSLIALRIAQFVLNQTKWVSGFAVFAVIVVHTEDLVSVLHILESARMQLLRL